MSEEAAETPIKVTEQAAKKALEIKAAENIPAEKVLRLRIQGGGCSGFSYDLYFDDAKPEDRRFSFFGLDVVVDEMSLMYLNGTEVDYVDGMMGSGFKFNNPNVKSTCGCGSSFSVD